MVPGCTFLMSFCIQACMWSCKNTSAGYVNVVYCIQQRQERLTDCSALLERERKVMHPLLMMLLAVFSLHLPHYSHSCCLLTLSILYSLKPLPRLFSLNFCAPSTSLSLFLSLPAPHPPMAYFPRRQDRRMLERRMAELEEELKVRRCWERLLSCPRALLHASARLAWLSLVLSSSVVRAQGRELFCTVSRWCDEGGVCWSQFLHLVA